MFCYNVFIDLKIKNKKETIMPILLQEQDPTAQPELAAGGNGAQPPEVKQAAVAAPEPPEREAFNPDQAELKAQTDAGFDAIAQTETEQAFAEITQNLGDVAAQGAQVISEHEANQN